MQLKSYNASTHSGQIAKLKSLMSQRKQNYMEMGRFVPPPLTLARDVSLATQSRGTLL